MFQTCELSRRLKMWVNTLRVSDNNKPLAFLKGGYRVLCFNYTEFIETLYGAVGKNICYIHGCRKSANHAAKKLVIGHRPGIEEEQWSRVDFKPIQSHDNFKRHFVEAALETAVDETRWYDEETTKSCDKIIMSHQSFFDNLTDIE